VFGALFISLFIAKFLTQPLVLAFSKMEKVETKNEDLIGTIATAKFEISDTKTSQIIVRHDGSEYTLEAKTLNSKIIKRHGQGLIIDYDNKSNFYIIEPIENV